MNKTDIITHKKYQDWWSMTNLMFSAFNPGKWGVVDYENKFKYILQDF